MKDPESRNLIGMGPTSLRRMLEPLRRRKPEDRISIPPCRDNPFSDDAVNVIIETDIVPRLLMAHSLRPNPLKPKKPIAIDESAVSRFAELPMGVEAAELMEEVDRFLDSGIEVETVYVELLAPAARALGEKWERDECDFIEVTMGLWRLQEVMREIGARYPSVRQVSGPINKRSCLFTPMPGDDHSFGALMIDDMFSRAGWKSEAVPQPERRELLDTVSRRTFDLIGLTVSRDCPIGVLRNLIQSIRSVSANQEVVILIGGRLVNDDPSIVAQVGADGTGADAQTALETAERLVASALERAQTPK